MAIVYLDSGLGSSLYLDLWMDI